MRAYHSASSDETGRRCERAWYYEYVEGRRDDEIPWSAIAHYVADRTKDEHGILWWRDPANPAAAVKGRQRSTSLGKAVHEKIEDWYRGEPCGRDTRWNDLPGKIALSGLHLLPNPSLCHSGAVESPIGTEPVEVHGHASSGVRVDGILWTGTPDLVVSAPGEFLRLGINAPDGWALVDHKSSRDIVAYGLRGDVDAFAGMRNKRWGPPGLLRDDFQANLYTYAICTERGLSELPAHWVYYETQDRRWAHAADAMISLDAATEHVHLASARARHLDTLEREQDAQQNVEACPKYGGCPHHISAGGPCNAQRSVGALIQASALKKRTPTMGLPAEAKAIMQGQAIASPAPAIIDGPPPPAAEPAKRGRGRPRNADAAPAVAPAQAPAPASFPILNGSAVERSFTLPGEFGAVVVTGHPADVLRVLQAVLHTA